MSVHQKLNIILASRVVQKFNLEKIDFTKKCSPKLIFLDEFFFWKNSVDFWHRKLTLKVQFWHFLRPRHYVNLQKTAISFEYSWFLSKNPAFKGPSSKKLHDLTDIKPHTKKWRHQNLSSLLIGRDYVYTTPSLKCKRSQTTIHYVLTI